MANEQTRRGKRLGLPIILGGGALVGIVMAVLTIGGGSIVSPEPAGVGKTVPTPIPDLVGHPAPDFTAFTPDGKEVTLSGLRGSPVALNFWATWCAPCEVDMLVLESATTRHADKELIVLAVNAGESADVVQEFMADLGLTFPTILDPEGEISDLYGAQFLPTTVWIGADGIVRVKYIGQLTEALIDDYVVQLAGK